MSRKPILEPGWRRTADALLGRIRSGAWPVGGRIPGTREIAREFGVRQTCAQRALASLARAGVVARRPRLGTVVTRVEPRIEIVAFVSFTRGWTSPYISRLALLACSRLEAAGFRAVQLVVPVSGGLDALRRALDESGAQGAIVANPTADIARALPSLPQPCVAPPRVDRTSGRSQFRFLDKALPRLREHGCRRPGLVSTTCFLSDTPPDPALPLSDCIVPCAQRAWRDCFRRAGFPFRPSLCAGIRNSNDLSPADCCALGFEAAARLLALPGERRPDSLAVFPDGLLPGVAQAILAAGIPVPERLRVISLRNLGAETFVSFPCDWIDNDIAAEAESFCRALLAKFP